MNECCNRDYSGQLTTTSTVKGGHVSSSLESLDESLSSLAVEMDKLEKNLETVLNQGEVELKQDGSLASVGLPGCQLGHRIESMADRVRGLRFRLDRINDSLEL